MFDAQQIFDGTFVGNPPVGAALTVSRQSTNILDLQSSRDIAGGLLSTQLNVVVQTAFVGAGAVLQILFQTAPDAATWVTLAQGPPIPVAQLTAGRILSPTDMPNNGLLNLNNVPNRYISLNYSVTSGTFTAGTILAWLAATADLNVQQVYPRNYNISA